MILILDLSFNINFSFIFIDFMATYSYIGCCECGCVRASGSKSISYRAYYFI